MTFSTKNKLHQTCTVFGLFAQFVAKFLPNFQISESIFFSFTNFCLKVFQLESFFFCKFTS